MIDEGILLSNISLIKLVKLILWHNIELRIGLSELKHRIVRFLKY